MLVVSFFYFLTYFDGLMAQNKVLCVVHGFLFRAKWKERKMKLLLIIQLNASVFNRSLDFKNIVTYVMFLFLLKEFMNICVTVA